VDNKECSTRWWYQFIFKSTVLARAHYFLRKTVEKFTLILQFKKAPVWSMPWYSGTKSSKAMVFCYNKLHYIANKSWKFWVCLLADVGNTSRQICIKTYWILHVLTWILFHDLPKVILRLLQNATTTKILYFFCYVHFSHCIPIQFALYFVPGTVHHHHLALLLYFMQHFLRFKVFILFIST